MEYQFTAQGHPKITATHTSTLMFTKDDYVTDKGDCIVGINADFDLEKIKEFLAYAQKKQISQATMIIEVDGSKEEVTGTLNPDFNDERELVVRTSDFRSERTLMVGADKSAGELRFSYPYKRMEIFLSLK